MAQNIESFIYKSLFYGLLKNGCNKAYNNKNYFFARCFSHA